MIGKERLFLYPIPYTYTYHPISLDRFDKIADIFFNGDYRDCIEAINACPIEGRTAPMLVFKIKSQYKLSEFNAVLETSPQILGTIL